MPASDAMNFATSISRVFWSSDIIWPAMIQRVVRRAAPYFKGSAMSVRHLNTGAVARSKPARCGVSGRAVVGV